MVHPLDGRIAMDESTRQKLTAVGELLIDQSRAAVLVEPRARESGFWFGGGNICRAADGALWLVGRYRNGGDSRTGIEAGPRGAELALLRSRDEGQSFGHVFSLSKKDLTCDGEEVLSIEGACLYAGEGGVRLYVSSEKERAYPERVREFQKPGTGVWSIDVLSARTPEGLEDAPARPALRSDEPAWLHVKDPVVFDLSGRRVMMYCSHPFSWASSNTGYAVGRPHEERWDNRQRSVTPRGPAWDVAVFRVTERLPLPPAGVAQGPMSLYFYDGAECVHDHGSGRAKGFSCEEIGGLAAGYDGEFPCLELLSVERPLFVSPHGTGCSRYVSVFDAEDYCIATWQQSQPDLSQPLVVTRTAKKEVERVLAG